MFPGDLSKVAAGFQPPLLGKLLVYDCGKEGEVLCIRADL